MSANSTEKPGQPCTHCGDTGRIVIAGIECVCGACNYPGGRNHDPNVGLYPRSAREDER